jgi:hypothetical protein
VAVSAGSGVLVGSGVDVSVGRGVSVEVAGGTVTLGVTVAGRGAIGSVQAVNTRMRAKVTICKRIP